MSNAKLGLKRARRPFHMYLADMRGTMGTDTRRRITKKRPIFRFDLLKLKFDRLPPDARGQYDEKGLAAVIEYKEQRRIALHRWEFGDGVSTAEARKLR